MIFNISGYFLLLSFFHFTEFFSTALYKPRDTSYKSFVVNHSVAYTAASIAAVVEYFVELLLFPSLKKEKYMVYLIGFLVSIIGQCKYYFLIWYVIWYDLYRENVFIGPENAN